MNDQPTSTGLHEPRAAARCATQRPLTLLICALGGEGGGVLAEWLVATAARCGYAAQSTSIPGVAQRTGATTYYVEFAREPDGTRTPPPVFSLYPVPGALDLLVASELLEAARQTASGLVAPGRTRVVASSERTLTTLEKMQLSDGRADEAALMRVLHRYSASVAVVDAGRLARETNTAISAVLLGAVAATGVLPFERAAYEETVRASGKGVDASLAGFARGHAAIAQPRGALGAQARGATRAPDRLPDDVAARFPHETHAMIAAGYARLVVFQDGGYAASYVERLTRVLSAERTSDAGATNGFATTREAARFLAAWMAYDDIARVADLKSRRSRFERIRREVRAGDDLVRVYDHFNPGIAEIASMLPERIAQALLRWDSRRIASGKMPFAMPVKLPSHGILGMAALRTLAALKRLRRRSSRYGDEQAAIERWLAAVEQGLARDWALGYELALCGRLIKGYGATHARGRETLAHIVEHLASSADTTAAAIRAVRDAALADDAGKALDRALRLQGAPTRSVRPQPIVWHRKRAARAEASESVR
jgi:indolepyruvate ferredoxin oxidoreductase beta subunit